MVKDKVLGSGSAVVQAAFMFPEELDWAKKLYNTSWYRSKTTLAGDNPFASYLLNKKWTLEGEFNNHMLRFQQVRVSSISLSKFHIDIPGWIDNH